MFLRLLRAEMSDESSSKARDAIDRAVFAVCELLGLTFALPFGDAIYRGEQPAQAQWIYLGVGILLGVAGTAPFWIREAWKRLRYSTSKEKGPLTYLYNEDEELGAAIRMMAWSSAWGKWYAAQHLAINDHRPVNEEHVMQIASSIVWEALKDGKLDAQGRKPGQLNYETIPRAHWRSTVPHMVADNLSLWKMILMPTGGAEFDRDGNLVRANHPPSKERTDKIAEYDSIIVNARQFETLWPRKDVATDRARKRLLKKARKAGADPTEIQKLSRE